MRPVTVFWLLLETVLAVLAVDAGYALAAAFTGALAGAFLTIGIVEWQDGY